MSKKTIDIEVVSDTLTCSTCREKKPPEDFYSNKSTTTGRDCYCKLCRDVYNLANSYPKKKLTVAYKAKMARARRRARAKYPEKTRAWQMAIVKKDELRKSACELCGATDRLHMHHPDYSKPLDVITLCQPCHVTVHHKGVKV